MLKWFYLFFLWLGAGFSVFFSFFYEQRSDFRVYLLISNFTMFIGVYGVLLLSKSKVSNLNSLQRKFQKKTQKRSGKDHF